jgi:hypothetical protein
MRLFRYLRRWFLRLRFGVGGIRQEPKNLQAEPHYPGQETVMLSMSHPDWTGHMATKRCPREDPHKVNECGEFA